MCNVLFQMKPREKVCFQKKNAMVVLVQLWFKDASQASPAQVWCGVCRSNLLQGYQNHLKQWNILNWAVLAVSEGSECVLGICVFVMTSLGQEMCY